MFFAEREATHLCIPDYNMLELLLFRQGTQIYEAP